MRMPSRIGTRREAPQNARRIEVTNVTALCGLVATQPYQVYYLLTDARHFLPIILFNAVVSLCYAGVLALNHFERHSGARFAVFGVLYLHLVVVTYLISAGAGVHFFFFPIAGTLGLLLGRHGGVKQIGLVGLGIVLWAVCDFAFPPGTTPLTVAPAALAVMYPASAMTALALCGALAFVFRLDLERAEAALVRTNEELERLSGADPLTGLANRRSLDIYLAKEWGRLRRHPLPISVLIIDIDCFKEYNDHYGHLAGDSCLQRVAATLSQVSRRGGDLVARFGGEEFVMVLPSTDEVGALQVAEQAKVAVTALRVPHERSRVAPLLTVSVGVASANARHLESLEQLLRQADAALYEAKRQGRYRVVQWSETLAGHGV